MKTVLTKQFFYKNFDLSTQEKKLFKKSIIEMNIWASLTEASTNILPVLNDEATYENVFIITIDVTAKDFQQKEYIANTIQKYFPYHCLLVIQNQEEFILSAALKRINKNDASKRVVIEEVASPILSKLIANPIQTHLLNQLDFRQLDKTSLETLYKDYFAAIVNFKASIAINKIVTHSKARTQSDLALLQQIDELSVQITNLDDQITKESRTNKIVELNTERFHIKKRMNDLKEELNQ